MKDYDTHFKKPFDALLPSKGGTIKLHDVIIFYLSQKGRRQKIVTNTLVSIYPL